MKGLRVFRPQSWLVGTATLLTVAGFWSIYFGSEPASPYHHLHLVTIACWLALLSGQLFLAANGNHRLHRMLGLLAVVSAPSLVAAAALLSVESAHRGLLSGQGDFMIVQNVMGTLELALIIFAAFASRGRRQLHAAFMVSTALLFMGIALFFTLIAFVPGFRIDGPETAHRFGKSLNTIQYASLGIGLLFFARNRTSGWPLLLAGSTFLLNEWIRKALAHFELIAPLTTVVGSVSQPLVFFTCFVVFLLAILSTGSLRVRLLWPVKERVLE